MKREDKRKRRKIGVSPVMEDGYLACHCAEEHHAGSALTMTAVTAVFHSKKAAIKKAKHT
jgi:hypothetical protein